MLFAEAVMPRSVRGLCAVAVAVAVLAAGALFAGASASACTSLYAVGCVNGNPGLPAEDGYGLIGDLPTPGGFALALWGGGRPPRWRGKPSVAAAPSPLSTRTIRTAG